MTGIYLNPKIPDREAVVYSFQTVKNSPTSDSGMLRFKQKKLEDTKSNQKSDYSLYERIRRD